MNDWPRSVVVSDELSQRFKLMALVSSFLVVAIHCCSNFHVANQLIRCGVYDGICRIAVPFFFMASGFFLAGAMDKKGWWQREVIKRIFSLGVPYLIWITLFILLVNGIVLLWNTIHGVEPLSGIVISVSWLLQRYGLHPLCHPVLLPLWYIRALLILVFISPIILYTMKAVCAKFGKGWLLCVMVFAFYLWLGRWEGISGNTTYFFRKFFALQGLFYFTLGIAWRLGYLQLMISRKLAIALLLVGGLLMFVKILLHINDVANYHFFGCCSIPFLVVAIFNLLPQCHIPNAIASCAFPVYVFHMFVITIIRQRLYSVAGGGYMIIIVVVYAITLVIVMFQRKYFGWLNRYLWGGR